jgi:hypothetical protein
MSLPNTIPQQIIEALASHALELGHFDAVNQHEPKSAPGNGLSCSIWVNSLGPASSGLVATSARLECSIRLYSNMLQEPQDMIDPNLMAAVWDLMVAYSGDLDLGITDIRSIDLLGAEGDPLRAEGGYIDVDRKMYRVMTISIGIVINDAFTQSR